MVRGAEHWWTGSQINYTPTRITEYDPEKNSCSTSENSACGAGRPRWSGRGRCTAFGKGSPYNWAGQSEARGKREKTRRAACTPDEPERVCETVKARIGVIKVSVRTAKRVLLLKKQVEQNEGRPCWLVALGGSRTQELREAKQTQQQQRNTDLARVGMHPGGSRRQICRILRTARPMAGAGGSG